MSPQKLLRPNWGEYACLLAMAASTRSEDPHTKTGAVVLDKNYSVLSTGYNGLTSGKEIPEWMFEEENRGRKAALMLHAEQNVFKRIRGGDPYFLAVTMEPCTPCANLIAAQGVKQVVYVKKYHKGDGGYKDVFDFYGIECSQLPKESLIKIHKELSLLIRMAKQGMSDQYER